MVWDDNDYNGFMSSTNNKIGQIHINSSIGQMLYKLVQDDNIVNILEIGTWNGLGSTKCIIDGLKKRKTPYKFYSLECNEEKSKFAKELYKDISNVHILTDVLLNDMPEDIFDIFPILKTDNTFKYYNKVDFDNMKDKPLFFNRSDLPNIFDIILLDGGEFTTWYEYLQIKDKCKYLFLDDTDVDKCKKIAEEVRSETTKWKILLDSNERNGTLVAIRI